MTDFEKIQKALESNDSVECRYFTKHDIYVYDVETGKYLCGFIFNKDYSLHKIVFEDYPWTKFL